MDFLLLDQSFVIYPVNLLMSNTCLSLLKLKVKRKVYFILYIGGGVRVKPITNLVKIIC